MEFDLESLCVFKLMNGEVIICEIVSEDETQVVVRYAIRAVEVIDGDEGSTQFVQWISYTDSTIILYRHGILAVASPSDEVKQMYLNRMAELDAPEEDPTLIEEFQSMRPQCRSGVFRKSRCNTT